jgi:hypothetical protein
MRRARPRNSRVATFLVCSSFPLIHKSRAVAPVFDWLPRVLIKNGEEGGGYEINPLGLLIKRAPQVSGKEKNKSLAPL